VALGVYCVITWGGVLSAATRRFNALTFGCPTFLFSMAGAALIGCIFGGVSAWSPSYVMRVLGAKPGVVGISLGMAGAIAASLSAVIGGFIGDRWKRSDRRRRSGSPSWAVAADPGPGVHAACDGSATYVCGAAVFVFLA